MEIEKIEQMFRSKDRELRKLAQKICHAHRITYHIFLMTYTPLSTYVIKPDIIGYSLYTVVETVLHELDERIWKYKDDVISRKINLDGERIKKDKEKVRDP